MFKIKSQSLGTFMFSPVFIFIFSIFCCIATLIIERSLGVGWDFHPDANTYLKTSEKIANDVYVDFSNKSFNFTTIINYLSLIKGSLFYFIVDFFNSNINLVLGLNIFFYSLTNAKISSFYLNNCFEESELFLGILFFLVIFNPYRIHLSVHVLKDTLIIASLVFVALNRRSFSSILYFIFGMFLRNGWIMYFFSFINLRKFKLIMSNNTSNLNKILYLCSIIFIIIYLYWFVDKYWGTIYHVLTTTNGNMTFREFDNVPSFYELGVFGSIIRATLWPLLYISGAFIILSPTIMYFPIALGSFLIQYWAIKQFKNPALLMRVYFSMFLSMAIFAFIVSGFTSYIRYCLPILTIMPILLIKEAKSIEIIHPNIK
jgi:hypothetical protein